MRTKPFIGMVMLTATLALGAAARAQEQPRKFCILTYPAQGHIQYDEGTVEIQMIWQFDAALKADARACPFDLVLPRQNWHYVFNYIGWANAFAFVGYADPQQRYVWSNPLDWKRGEAHQVAVTWQGDRRSVFLDGKPTVSSKRESSLDLQVEGWLHGDMTEGLVYIGYGSSFMVVDELRISSIARTPEAIEAAASKPFEADRYTLLLDHCDGGEPEVVARLPGVAPRRFNGPYEIVDGRFGKAFRLWTGPDWQPQ